MKFVALILLIIALAIPASASSVVSWTQKDITGYNPTLNYTSGFNVAKDDILNISIKNIGNEEENDTITVYKIRVTDPSEADGLWTGSVNILPDTSETIDFELNVDTNDEETVNIKLYYTVNLENKTLNIKANYPGTPESPEIKPWNNMTNSRSRTLSVNIDQAVRFNATADQPIETWVWRKDNVVQVNYRDYFITSWSTYGTKTVKVNATNDNGTSNTITWNVTVNALQEGNAPYITSWGNNKTNDDNLNLTINQSETVRFNFTANQTLTSWTWTLNGGDRHRSADNLTYTFNHEGTYRVGASGSNGNGSTQTIVWNVTVQEKEVNTKKTNAMILTWSPQVVDYVYLNATINETITYSITTAELMEIGNWSEDGVSVDFDSIDIIDNTSTFTRKWTNDDLGFHTIVFKGSNDDTNVEFRWYVNVYNMNGYEGGCLFCVIDDELEDHVADVKFRMFKYKIAKYGSNSEDAIEYVNRLHDRIAARQMTREALRNAFKVGDISISEYVAALKQIQRDVKYELKLAEKMTKIEEGNGEDEQDNEYKHDDENERRLNKLADMNNKMKAKNVEEQKKKENPGNNGRSKKNQNGNNKAHNEEDD
jgi:hypothetical protein